MRARSPLRAVIAVCLLLALGACRPVVVETTAEAAQRLAQAEKRARAAVESWEQLGSVKMSLDDLNGIPREDLSIQDAERRTALIRQLGRRLDEGTLRLATLDADTASRNANAMVSQLSAQTLDRLSPNLEPDGLGSAIVKMTEDALKGAACDAVLQDLAPDQRPAIGGTAPEPYSLAKDFPVKAAEELAKDWQAFTVGDLLYNARGAFLLKWSNWFGSDIEDGDQVASAIAADPGAYIQLALRPPVQRTALAYARFCYATPQKI